jgi:hypothetical protein
MTQEEVSRLLRPPANVALWGNSPVLWLQPLAWDIGRSTYRIPVCKRHLTAEEMGIVMTPIQRFAILRALKDEAEALKEEHKSTDSEEKTNSEKADEEEKTNPPQKS